MSRRTDLIEKLVKSDRFGKEKKIEQGMLMATAELILGDFLDIAITGLEKNGPGVLIINLLNDSTVYMTGAMLEADISEAERNEDTETKDLLVDLVGRVNDNDYSKTLLITIFSDAGPRTFQLEAGRSQESLRALAAEFTE